MDNIDDMIGGLTGQTEGGSGSADIVGAFGGLIGGEGGLQNLVGQLQSSGLGNQVGSWVGIGPNQAVDPQELHQALGDDKVSQLASQSGLPIAQFLPLLAAALPSIVDALTPNGNVPAGNAAAGFDIGGLLEGLGSAAQAGPNSPLGQLGGLLAGNKG